MDIFNKVFQTKPIQEEEITVVVLTTDEKINLLNERRSTMLEDVKLIDEELAKLQELKLIESELFSIEARRAALGESTTVTTTEEVEVEVDIKVEQAHIHRGIQSGSKNTDKVLVNPAPTSVEPKPGEHKQLKVGDLTVSPAPSGKKTTMAAAMTNAMKK